jgi:Undecaprenyl-phosphate glucose phosphotransferase
MSPLEQSHFGSGLWHGGLQGGVSRRWSIEVLQTSAFVVDVALIIGSAMASALLRVGVHDITLSQIERVLQIGILGAVLFIGFLALRGGYGIARLSATRRQSILVVQGWGFVFFVLAWVAFLFKVTDELSRGVVTLFFVFGGIGLLAAHAIGAALLARQFARGAMSHSRVAVVAVADPGGLERIVRRLAEKGVDVAAVTTISPARVGRSGFLGACREAVGDIRTALAATKLDGVYLFLSWRERRHIDELKAALSPMPIPVYLFADTEIERLLRRPQVDVGDFVGFELQRAPLSRTDRAMKRLLDIAVAATALILLTPLMLLTSIAIVAESGLPVLFKQNRKGFGARPFPILKFRSMKVMENGQQVTQASKNDMRVTRIGRVIRRTSIDELPQLINVLRGDMSIVGPRPHAIAHDDHYDKLIASYAFRQHVKPGITGWAQVNGCRGETKEVDQMKNRVEHDIWYINNWSLWLDLRIIVMTALKIFFDKQAY